MSTRAISRCGKKWPNLSRGRIAPNTRSLRPVFEQKVRRLASWNICLTDAWKPQGAAPSGKLLRVCLLPCLPDERHITGLDSRMSIVDKDRIRAGHLNVHRVGGVDEHHMVCRASGSLCDGSGVIRF